MADDRKLGKDGPPVSYRLEDVTVVAQRQQGHGQPTRQLTLSGKGRSILQSGEQKQGFDYAASDLLSALNDLYRIRFFELPSQIRQPLSIFLKDDGTVGTQALKMSDAGSTMVCFRLPNYEKCVQYGAAGPRELDELVQRLLADANQRAASSR